MGFEIGKTYKIKSKAGLGDKVELYNGAYGATFKCDKETRLTSKTAILALTGVMSVKVSCRLYDICE